MSKCYETQYLELMSRITSEGVEFNNRTGIPCKQLFGVQMSINLQDGFPLLTTKYVHFKSVCGELLWFLSGKNDISYLKRNNIRIWDKWADEEESVGPMYGAQWTNWNGTLNQLDRVIEEIKNFPTSRRLVVSAWNAAFIPDNISAPKTNPSKGLMALAPCHAFFQFFVDINSKKLSCLFFMRSNDVFLGLPFNIASYALLTHIIAAECNLKVGKLIYQAGNSHLYQNHSCQVAQQLSLQQKKYPLPKLEFVPKKSIYEYEIDNFKLNGYKHHPKIYAPIAV